MGLFTAITDLFSPKPSQYEMEHIQNLIQQAQDSANLVNTTVKPDIFFKRLNFLLDILLELMKYEKYKIFKRSLPSEDYKKVLGNLNATVNDFIDRSYSKTLEDASKLKTETAKRNRVVKYSTAMLSAFEMANSFWSGNNMYPHYEGNLFTDDNLNRVKEIAASVDVR